jgi:Na+/H+ antiporter NhaA
VNARAGAAQRVSEAFRRFVALEASSTILLLGATVAALALANSPLRDAYEHALHLPLARRDQAALRRPGPTFAESIPET